MYKKTFIDILTSNGEMELIKLHDDEVFEFDEDEYDILRSLMYTCPYISLYFKNIQISPMLFLKAAFDNENLAIFLIDFLGKYWLNKLIMINGIEYYLIQLIEQPKLIDLLVIEGSVYGDREKYISEKIINSKENYIKYNILKDIPTELCEKIFNYLKIVEVL